MGKICPSWEEEYLSPAAKGLFIAILSGKCLGLKCLERAVLSSRGKLTIKAADLDFLADSSIDAAVQNAVCLWRAEKTIIKSLGSDRHFLQAKKQIAEELGILQHPL